MDVVYVGTSNFPITRHMWEKELFSKFTRAPEIWYFLSYNKWSLAEV